MANFNPNSDATELWLDGADADTLSYHAGTEKVSEWRDKSGHDRHCGQTDTNRAPRRFGAGIAFDGGQSLIATGLSLPYQNQDFTLGILVSGSTSNGSSYEPFFSAAEQPQDFGAFALVRYPKPDRQRIDGSLGSDLANYIYGENGTYSSKGEPHQTIVLTKKAGEVSIRVGGATHVTQPAISSNDLIIQYMIGSSGFSTADYLYGACFEVVLAYNADPIEVEGYLSRKWGTAYALPADHPYHISSGDFLPPSTQAAKVSGIVQIDGTPAKRTVRAFGYNPTVHDIDDSSVSLSKSLGHATSDPQTGEYTIDLLGGYGKEIFVVAFDDYGAEFRPDRSVTVGDRIHPTTPNGYVWECAGAGALPSEEPAWIIDTETAQLYGTASMITVPFYRPMVHGPVMPEVTVIENPVVYEPAIFDAATKSDGIVLVDDFTIEKTSGSWVGAKLGEVKEAGKWYFEFSCNQNSGAASFGLARPSASVSSNMVGKNGYIALNAGSDQLYNGASVEFPVNVGANDRVGFACDFDAGILEIFVNGISKGTIALSGQWVPMASLYYTSVQTTINTGQSEFPDGVPEGFNAGWLKEVPA